MSYRFEVEYGTLSILHGDDWMEDIEISELEFVETDYIRSPGKELGLVEIGRGYEGPRYEFDSIEEADEFADALMRAVGWTP